MTQLTALWRLALVALGVTLATPAQTGAQTAPAGAAGAVQPSPDTPAPTEVEPEYREGEILYLEEGRRAPWTGLLIEQPDLVRWRLTIDNLRYRLAEDVKFEAAKCDVQIKFEHQRQDIEREGYRLKESMQQDRAKELAATIVELKADVAKARERGLLEQPILWYVAGIGSAVAIALLAQ